EDLVAKHPFREHFVAQLMLALSRSGRQAEALRAYRAARSVLAEELGLETSEELRNLESAILLQERTAVAPARPDARHPTNLRSSLTSLIGRGTEIDALTALLNDHRLVTILGPGGAGKTHLAVEVARRWFDEGGFDVWVVEFAPFDDEDAVMPTIAAAV